MNINYYANGLVYPHFPFALTNGKWTMLGNPGMVGDDGEYDSPLSLSGTPEQFMSTYFGNNWQ